MQPSPRDEARHLRVDPGLSLSQLRARFGVGNDTLAEWLRGLPPPGWTRRPNAKDDLRAQAVKLRGEGCSVPQIAAELGVAKSTAYQWTKHIPLDPASEAVQERRRRHAQHMTDTRWEPHRRARDAARAAEVEASAAWVGELSDREVLLLGATAYWCEGAKAKPWRPNARALEFINSDPMLILLFLRFLEIQGVHRSALRYRLSIHESADVESAARWWAEVIAVPHDGFQRPSLKRHNPTTVRRNVGDSYRGCLVVSVPRSSRFYWKIEGLIRGIAVATAQARDGTV